MEIREVSSKELAPTLEAILDRQQLAAGFPQEEATSLAFGLYQEERLVGGLLAKISMETAHINLLAIDETLRGQDWGTKLMAHGEEAFKELGLKNITLTTRSYQAKGFYEKQGFDLFAELADVPKVGITRYYFIKRLA
ncbi:GNAT family N-acetyltransferase [Enterococcus asini]|uniref:GNAT family N-acetyltransferase n=2 Tax=Enterococcus asini TaxID=57732 RepID=UPI000E531F18|nr:GNAT family N-acetyltransferase [Enterococcus asini]RGW12915.1 GNAT family N-acetyltransferase [Enterococcus asini]